jgi:hypothetical protein
MKTANVFGKDIRVSRFGAHAFGYENTVDFEYHMFVLLFC